MRGIGINRRIGVGLLSTRGGGGVPFSDDLEMNLNTLESNTLLDSIGTDSAELLLPEFISDGVGTSQIYGDKTRIEERLLDGNDYTVFFSIKQDRLLDTNYYIAFLGNSAIVNRGIRIRVSSGLMKFEFGDGTKGVDVNTIYQMDTTVYPLDFINIKIDIYGTTKIARITLYDKNGNIINTDNTLTKTETYTEADLSTLTFSESDNTVFYYFNSPMFAVFNFKKYSAITSYSDCINSITTNLQMMYPSIWGLADVSGNGLHLSRTGITITDKKYYSVNDYLLNYGADYERSSNYPDPAYPDINIPRLISGDDHLEGVGTSRIYELPASNLCPLVRDMKIRFSNNFFDRSNTTIWNDDCRNSDYYDETNSKDFHQSELNQRTIFSYLNDGYRGRLFVKVKAKDYTGSIYYGSIEQLDRQYIYEVLLYSTDKKSTECEAVLKYTGDNKAVVYSSGVMQNDVNGYPIIGNKKLSKGVLMFRIDDAYQDCYDDWFPFFTNNGLVAQTNAHANLMGGAGENLVPIMSWTNLIEMYNAGWEIGSHNFNDNDYATMSLPEIKEDIESNYNGLLDQGINIKSLVGNRLSCTNPSIEYLAWKNKHFCNIKHTGLGGSVHSANPANLELYNIGAIALDTGDATYKLDQSPINAVDQINAIKAEIDDAYANNKLLICYFHAHQGDLETNIQTIIDYAKSVGIDIGTIDDVYNDIDYRI